MSKQPTVAEYLSKQIDACGKSQADIAREIGYDRPNVISMIKKGGCKLPLTKVGLLAKALSIDPAFLFQLAMSEYMPDSWSVIQEFQGAPVTKNEHAILERIRELSKNADPKLQSPSQQKALKAFVDSMVG